MSENVLISDDKKSEKTLEENGEAEGDALDAHYPLLGSKLILLHLGLCLSTFLTGLDFNMIATAVPAITSEFNSIEDVGWYGSAFYIALCATQTLAGKIYILFPKKAVFLCYLAVFETGSLACALAPSSKALIVGRAIAGLGASGIFAGSMIIMTVLIPLHKRAIWQGTLTSTFSIASIVGPIIGGALTQHITWRWCFYLNLPVGGFSAIVVLLFLRLEAVPTQRAPLAQKLKSLDSLGFVLFSGSIIMLLLALQWGGSTSPWNSSMIIGLFVGFGVVMAAFVWWQIYFEEHALIPFEVLKNRNAVLICISAVFTNGPFQVIVYWLPIWFQAILAATPTSSGIRYLPTVISDVLTSFVGAAIVTKLGFWNPFLLTGGAFISIGAGLLTTLYPGVSIGHWIGYQILGGTGYSLVIIMAHLGVQASLPPKLVPIGATTLLFVMTASCAVFLAVGQTIFDERLVHNLNNLNSPGLANELLSVGATQIRNVTRPEMIDTVLRAYSDAVTKVFYLPAIAPVISFIAICGTKWTSLKKDKTPAQPQ